MSRKTDEATDDELTFVEEDAPAPAGDAPPWKVLIVDDEPEVHEVTKLALRNVEFSSRPLAFASAYSAKEAKDLLGREGDFALAIVDVIMEADDAGLQLVRYIRHELRDKRLRIVMRTGQPGMHQEQDVMVAFEINDYKAKTELTRARLMTTLIASLRTVEYIDELSAMHERLKLANKLGVIGELSLGLFHEIATPITIVSSANELIRDALKGDDASLIAQASAKIDRGCKRILSLTRHLKEFAWSGREAPTPVLLKALFQGALDMCSVKLRLAGVAVTVSLPEDEATVTCSNRQVEQVLINLINNACDAMGGTKEKQIVLRGAMTADACMLDVADTGPGIPTELRDKIFQSFFTTKEKGKGTGLGLSICIGILEPLGGRLELVGGGGIGARFRITLPLKAPAQVAMKAS